MVRSLKHQFSKLYGVYVTNIKALIRCTHTAPYNTCNTQVFSVSSTINVFCDLLKGMKKGAIPAACLHHALYTELPAGS